MYGEDKEMCHSEIPVGPAKSGAVGGGASPQLSEESSKIPMNGGMAQPVMQDTSDKNMAD